MEFAPFQMAHTPLSMAAPQVHTEVRYAWEHSYSPEATRAAIEYLKAEPAPYKISHLAARLFFRGIYFPQKGAWQWLRLVASNWSPILRIVRESFQSWGGTRDGARREFSGRKIFRPVETPEAEPGAD